MCTDSCIYIFYVFVYILIYMFVYAYQEAWSYLTIRVVFSRIVIAFIESYMNWKNVMHILFVAGTTDLSREFPIVIVVLDVKSFVAIDVLSYWIRIVGEWNCEILSFCFTRWVVFWLWYNSLLCRLSFLLKLRLWGFLCNCLLIWVSAMWMLVCYFIILCFIMRISGDWDG